MRLVALALVLVSALLAGPAAADKPGKARVQRWAWLEGTLWYVPAAYLPTVATSAATSAVVPLRDQTVYSIDGYRNGYYWGVARVQLLGPGEPGEVEPDYPPTCMRMVASVTPEGSLNVSFAPMGEDGERTTGIGTMRKRQGQWMMELQMTTGETVQVTHWAYMRACPKKGACKLPAISANARDFLSACKSPR